MKKTQQFSKRQLSDQFAAVSDWFISGRGQKLLTLEKPLLDRALSYCFGRFLLEAGPVAEFTKPIKDIKMIVKLGCRYSKADIIADEVAWPVLTESIEVVVLQHALDFACSPHDLLRESARCVRPGGHIIIVGLNPVSGWGFYRRCRLGIFRRSHSLSSARLKDWLRLLGFAIDHYWTGGYCLPTKGYKKDKLTLLETIGQHHRLWGNGFYLLSARKMMVQPTPLIGEDKLVLTNLAPVPVVGRNDIEAYE